MLQLRIDDIGASTKHFNQHGQKVFRYRGVPFFYFPFANVGPLKRFRPFRKWGVYDELTAQEWQELLILFRHYGVQPVVAVTATWVEKDGTLTPFPEKFPDEARVLKAAADKGEIIIANHGLTHCIVGEHQPRFWRSNRYYHREFYDWLPQEIHNDHVKRSQIILETYFSRPIDTFVPPGNIWSYKTYFALKQTTIKRVISRQYMMDSTEHMDGIQFIDDTKGWVNIHDRELKLYGREWAKKTLEKMKSDIN